MGNSCNREVALALVYNGRVEIEICSKPALKSALERRHPETTTDPRKSSFASSPHIAYLGGTGQPIARLSDADVQAQLPDVQVPHHILGLVALDLGAIGLLSDGLKTKSGRR